MSYNKLCDLFDGRKLYNKIVVENGLITEQCIRAKWEICSFLYINDAWENYPIVCYPNGSVKIIVSNCYEILYTPNYKK